MHTANLGYPRIGPRRELKRAVEGFWRGRIAEEELLAIARSLRVGAWRHQAETGLDFIPSNDFSLYDHVLDHVAMFGLVPEGYGWHGGEVGLDAYFAMARGTDEVPALEMTKWFNTNYHFISATLTGRFALTENKPLKMWTEARDEAGLDTRPVIIGPYTFLRLANNPADLPLPGLMEALVPLYQQVLGELATAGVTWVQMDEPCLVQEPGPDHLEIIASAYHDLDSAPRPRLMLQTYFDDVATVWDDMCELPVDGIGIDVVYGPENLAALEAKGVPDHMVLGLGLVDGRNVWRTDLDRAQEFLDGLSGRLDPARVVLGPSCSLLHLPHSAAAEENLDPVLRDSLAFANERLAELSVLKQAVSEGPEAVAAELAVCRKALARRRADPRTRSAEVRRRVASQVPADPRRATPAVDRRLRQQELLNLPPLPTTTIGSFPQTKEVRQARSRHRRGETSDTEYAAFLDAQFSAAIALQEDLGLDVLVHGEFERSDMVDYFAQRLEGMAFIEGWVQSFGTRCVRPPVIFGDILRPAPMTVEVARRVQSMTRRPLKGMLTGPVTMLMWSFARDDVPRHEVAAQLALAIRDEVADLEAAGIRIIQIDEPAFREGLPLQRSDWDEYLDWAARAFRLASSGVRDETQIHTHMCYSEFNDIMPAIAAMDADVISIENSRSAGELLDAFRDFDYDRCIGPGVYDVHTERVPGVDDMVALIRRSAHAIRPELLWVNPDCGLKTRDYAEVKPALANMVAAAHRAREELFAHSASSS